MASQGIGSILGGTLGNFLNMAGIFGDDDEDRLYQALAQINAVDLPGYDMSSVSPAVLQQIAQYQPETYGAQMVGTPEQVQANPELDARQYQALADLGQMQQTGFTDLQQLQMQDAQREMSSMASGLTQRGLEGLQESGRAGGGQQALLRGMANQAGMQRAGDMGRGFAQQGIMNQLQSILSGSDITGQMQNRDLARKQANADSVNRFNMLASNLATNAAADAAMSRQNAGFANQENRQRVSDTNAMNRQGTQTTNLDRQNRLRTQGYDDAMTKAMAQAGILGNASQLAERNRLAQEQNASQLSRRGMGLLGGVFGAGLGF